MNEKEIREKQITKTSVIGIIANLFLAGFKALVGLLAGSIAIILDAVNNMTDALSSVITIVGIKLAKRAPDKDHPFGHGRVEYFSAILIAALVLTAGITSLIESVKKIIHPETPDYSVLTLVIVAVAVIVKLLLGRFVKKQGEKYNSDALVASGSDASFDAIISASTLVGAAIAMLFHFSVDAYLGAVIACFIIKAGLEMFMESIGSIMGARPDSLTTLAIKKAVAGVEGVKGAYDLILHNYGPDSAIGSIHIEVEDDLTARQIHQLTKRIQLMVMDQFHIFMTVGIYALDSSRREERKEIHRLAMAHPGVLGTHGVFIDDELKYVSFDTVADFTVKDKAALRAELISEVNGLFPGYTVAINFDTNYSD